MLHPGHDRYDLLSCVLHPAQLLLYSLFDLVQMLTSHRLSS